MLAVRDGMASFFFHSFVKLDHLKTIVQGIKRQGYQFVSLKSYGCRVKTHNRAVSTVSGSVQLNLDNEFLRTALLDSSERVLSETVSTAPISGRVERNATISGGQLSVMEGLVERPEPKKSGWMEEWRGKLASLLTRSDESKPQQQLVGVATVLWVDAHGNPATASSPKSSFAHPVSGSLPEAVEIPPEERNDQESFRAALRAFGIHTQLLPLDRFGGQASLLSEVVVVPFASGRRLSAKDREALVNHVRSGGRLVFDGETELSRQLGIRFEGRHLPVSRMHDLNFPDVQIEWKPAADFPKFIAPRGAKPLFVEPESQAALGVLGRMGQGSYLFLGPLFDPTSPLGFSRFPYLMQILRTSFNLQPLARRPQLEVYFDPGLRPGISMERLVRSWRSFGVKIVYAAAWATDYRKWDFNYPYFIDLCHKNGILVYAWFELPQVNERFWDAHPEWREKTATGADGHVGWRLLMNLSNADCRKAAFATVTNVLGHLPWDGVNIAELNYDTDHGPLNPAKYVPMNDDVRRDFAAAAGFDPRLLFDPASPYYWQKNPKAFERFDRFRSGIVTEWHREILEQLTPICRKNQWELVVTMLDSLHSDTLTRDTGVDSERILALMDRYPFTLQVEDPAEFWSQSPGRYAAFVETYLNRVPDRRRLIFDLNVIPARNVSKDPLPTSAQTGIEFAQMLYHAAQASGRVAVYAESTLALQDFEVMDSVLAHAARVVTSPGRTQVDTPFTVLVRIHPEKTYRLDGRPWPFREFRHLIVPPGQHEIVEEPRKLSWIDWNQLALTVKGLHGELLEGSPTQRGLRFRYSGSTRVVALLSRQPYQVWLDGKEFESKAGFYQGDWSLNLPPGEHVVEVLANSPAYFLLDVTSLFSSSLIVILGFGFGGVLVALYFCIVLRRWVKSGWLWVLRSRSDLAKTTK
jgi:hypothetical protein